MPHKNTKPPIPPTIGPITDFFSLPSGADVGPKLGWKARSIQWCRINSNRRLFCTSLFCIRLCKKKANTVMPHKNTKPPIPPTIGPITDFFSLPSGADVGPKLGWKARSIQWCNYKQLFQTSSFVVSFIGRQSRTYSYGRPPEGLP